MTSAQREQYEERAAIMEFDGGLSREEAERLALKEVCKGEQQEMFVDNIRRRG